MYKYIWYTWLFIEKAGKLFKKKNLNCAYKKFITKNYIYGECVLEN
jgi:hypothetical protein